MGSGKSTVLLSRWCQNFFVDANFLVARPTKGGAPGHKSAVRTAEEHEQPWLGGVDARREAVTRQLTSARRVDCLLPLRAWWHPPTAFRDTAKAIK